MEDNSFHAVVFAEVSLSFFVFAGSIDKVQPTSCGSARMSVPEGVIEASRGPCLPWVLPPAITRFLGYAPAV